MVYIICIRIFIAITIFQTRQMICSRIRLLSTTFVSVTEYFCQYFISSTTRQFMMIFVPNK